ncbi:6710_t:CDS:2 [Funneliformis geosporum]|uniref:17768_t:CDS:1 n=1 Tax=Funneliformis geosporum TaxID=1117311 RepID=A0A9W4WNH7_9GLOM|nr:6710_t:CDS:2 [Funneliformis geosporum]CAI2175062.1 17768_t:CDS:2 [Funneliformis geosporum]
MEIIKEFNEIVKIYQSAEQIEKYVEYCLSNYNQARNIESDVKALISEFDITDEIAEEKTPNEKYNDYTRSHLHRKISLTFSQSFILPSEYQELTKKTSIFRDVYMFTTLEQGLTLANDVTKSAQFNFMSVDRDGNRESAYKCVEEYAEYGIGVKKDLKESVMYFTKAAENGIVDGMHVAAKLYFSGRAGKKMKN